jgi:nitrite reductase/ring-hydroxylating ferredoxin subunit
MMRRMGEAQSVPGPDLSLGVEVSALVEGEPLLGHVGEEAVILVRGGGEVLAAGATCTHCGGPLAEGLVISGTVRCPWHYACFDPRTGEALRARALNPIPTDDGLEPEAAFERGHAAALAVFGSSR